MGKKFKISASKVPSGNLCIVSDQVAVNGKAIGFMVKHVLGIEDYSGWQFLSGEEKEAYVANPHTGSVFDIEDIKEFDDRVADYLDSVDGSEIVLSD